MHTSNILSYTQTQTHKLTHNYTYIKHIYAKAHKHVSTPMHLPAHIHSCTHIRALARTHTHTYTYTHSHTHSHTYTFALMHKHLQTCAQTLTYTRAYKTKMHSQTLRTTRIHSQIHSFDNTRP